MMGDSNEVRSERAKQRLRNRRSANGTSQGGIQDVIPSVWIYFLVLVLGAAGLSQSVALAKQELTNLSNEEQFRQVVLPILQKRCFGCHSHGSGLIESELALDFRTGWEKGGSRGPALEPGNPLHSLLVKAIKHELPDLKMPEERMSESEIQQIESWIERGAFDDRLTAPAFDTQKPREWWSLRPLIQVTLPVSTFPNPIDGYIAAKLAQNKLSHSARADRRTLIRRLYFDLVGLPPTPEEVRAFESDPSDQAYRQLVDRLLASERYGERWARHWMDAIHFADSHGYEHDVGRDHAWPYRDYLIDALNQDKPWSRMIREQLAADHFFPDQPQLVPALGFLGAGTLDLSTFATAPVTFDYLDRDDLVTQTMAAFTSTTANCARCHSHKFDPISQEDYYSLQAVFAGILKGDVEYDASPEINASRHELRRVMDAAKERNGAILFAPTYEPQIMASLSSLSKHAKWESLDCSSYVSTDGSTLTRQSDGSLLASGLVPERDTYVLTATPSLAKISALRLDVLAHESLPMNGPGRCHNGNLHLSEIEVMVFDPANPTATKVPWKQASADFNQVSWGIERAIDGDPSTAWGIHPSVGQSHYAVFEFAQPQELPEGATVSIVLKQLHGGSHLIGSLKLSVTANDPDSIHAKPLAVEQILQKHQDLSLASWGGIPENDRLTIAAHLLQEWALKQQAALPQSNRVFAAGTKVEIPEGNGSYQRRSIDSPKNVHVLHRGDFDKPRAAVIPGSLSVLEELPSRFSIKDTDTESVRRSQLANWIADKQNVLTWRSIVNRVWRHHFGRGLCDTPSDFGRMGGTPSHPELLDWLAVWFRDDAQESLKQLHRLIVTSETYCQVSIPSADGNQIDADNRWLWRQDRQRLDADSIRDYILCASRQIELSMGGPAVQHFRQSKGPQSTPTLDYQAFDWNSEAGRRRSIYRYVWRGIADPFMEAVDFPDLGLLAPTRGFSASSLQALALFNNDFILHHSQAMATDLETSLPDINSRVEEAVWRLWGRKPEPLELQELSEFARAKSLAELCRVLFNTNEFLFVD